MKYRAFIINDMDSTGSAHIYINNSETDTVYVIPPKSHGEYLIPDNCFLYVYPPSGSTYVPTQKYLTGQRMIRIYSNGDDSIAPVTITSQQVVGLGVDDMPVISDQESQVLYYSFGSTVTLVSLLFFVMLVKRVTSYAPRS